MLSVLFGVVWYWLVLFGVVFSAQGIYEHTINRICTCIDIVDYLNL